MRVLILGGTRFMGPDVVRRLRGEGHAVTVFHRGRTEGELPAEVAHLHGEYARLPKFAAEFRDAAPEVVLDMIPFTEASARTVVDTFRGLARRLVSISSIDVYRAYGRLIGTEPGPPDKAPLTEDSPLREKLYPYRGESPRAADDPQRWLDDYDKILVERVAMGDPELPGTVLRLPMVYGPRDGQHRLFPYLKRMDDGRTTILMDESGARMESARGYVENVAAAIALAVTDDRAAGRIYNVAESENLPEAEWVRRIGQAAGWSGEVIVLPKERLPEHLAPRIDAEHHLTADSIRIRTELGFAELVPQPEALRHTVAWERVNPPQQFDAKQFDYAAEDAALRR